MRYTVLTYIYGNYEQVHEVGEKDPDADYILLTDRTDLESRTWRIVHEPLGGMGLFEKMYSIRFNPFDYAGTDIVLRVDGSIGIHRPLRPFVDELERGGYDRCLMIHPKRNTMPEEYAEWVRIRGYPERQAERCLQAIRGFGYPMGCRGLFQMNFEVLRDNAVNRELNRRTLQLLHDLGTEKDVERIDQTLFSAIANHFFSSRLKVLPVAQNIITEGYWMTWYNHGTFRPHRSRIKIPPVMFDAPCRVWQPPCP